MIEAVVGEGGEEEEEVIWLTRIGKGKKLFPADRSVLVRQLVTLLLDDGDHLEVEEEADQVRSPEEAEGQDPAAARGTVVEEDRLAREAARESSLNPGWTRA